MRLFNEHNLRVVNSLDGFWKFKTDNNNVGKTEKWYLNGFEGKNVYVPSVWNTDINLLNYEGVCWYETEFNFVGGTLKLNFGAVMTYAEVYLDGEFLTSHYGGFTAFNFIKFNVNSGKHKLTVMVDNSYDKSAIPQPCVDWFNYGGITRSVEIEKLNGISIINNKFHYVLDNNNANCYAEIDVINAENSTITDNVLVYLNDVLVSKVNVTINANERKTIKTDNFVLENVKLWSPTNPNLYTIKYQTSTDDLIDKTGFRLVEVKNKKIYLSGEEFIFKGVNRHEENIENGMAFPPSLMQRDIDIIKNMNANSIRGSHYPNNKIFIDMLDEQGLTFWSEIPIWGCGFSNEALADELVISRGLTMHKEMVNQYYNHPSILIWGLHNEINSDSVEGYEISKIYYNYLKEAGGNRIVTYATRVPLTDICYEFCDVICCNRYIGWYESEIEDWDQFVIDYDNYLKSINQQDKPIIISEFGSASLYGYNTFDDIRWTEEYQARLFDYTINLFLNKCNYVGTYVWQFANIRTSKRMSLDRARGYNNKGIVDEYRRPKLAYYTIKNVYSKIK